MARTGPSSDADVCLYFLAIFISPIPVLMKTGCGVDFVINICLFILGWLPGVVHAWWIIAKNEDRRPTNNIQVAPKRTSRWSLSKQPQYVAPPPQHHQAQSYAPPQPQQPIYNNSYGTIPASGVDFVQQPVAVSGKR